jgi:hypothetical protein
VELVGEVEGRVPVKGVLAHLGLGDLALGIVAQVDAQLGVCAERPLVFGAGEIETEERAGGEFAFARSANAAGGIRDEHERDDYEDQQGEEDPLKVLLEGALNPGNHRGKGRL